MKQRIAGLLVDVDALGTGVYDIICQRGEEALVAFGMIPLPVIEMLRDGLREKVIAEAAKQVACDPAEIAPYVQEDEVKKIVARIEREVCSAIYRTAAQRGKMVV